MLKFSRQTWIYLGFFAALLLGFYFVLASIIPGFTKKKTAPVSYVRPFAFTNQDGRQVTERDVAGKVYVAEYFFTTCKGICPAMNANMKRVYDRFQNQEGFLILSHTSDPEVDSPQRLRIFADGMQVNTEKWIFLTGRKDSLYNTARVSYVIDDKENNLTRIEDDFLHTQFWALVDKKGDVRKIVDGLKQSDVNEMMKDIEKLLSE